ncbi:AN1-type zinc finger protein 4 [Gaertneriomyces sp. JEL0708]|nr:AN1-type zinc finger protein 4 [Gaertneriomyces sp. JEL0708]
MKDSTESGSGRDGESEELPDTDLPEEQDVSLRVEPRCTRRHHQQPAVVMTSCTPENPHDYSEDDTFDEPTSRFLTLNVATLTGGFPLRVRPEDSVDDVKRIILEQHGIAVDSQILVWKERALTGGNTLAEFGIRDGSSLQLVLHMSAGPGPPSKPRKLAKEDDSIIWLLCREDDDMYMLEFRMTEQDLERVHQRRLLELAQIAGVNLGGDFLSRPALADSRWSSSLHSAKATSHNGRQKSRSNSAATMNGHVPDSKLGWRASEILHRPSSGDLAFDNSLLQVLPFGKHSPSTARGVGYPATPRKRLRPATAISVMRLRDGSGSMIIIPKTRPASASVATKGTRSVLDDTPLRTPQDSRTRATSSQTRLDGSRIAPTSTLRTATPSKSKAKAAKPCAGLSPPKALSDADSMGSEHVQHFNSTAVNERPVRKKSTGAPRKTRVSRRETTSGEFDSDGKALSVLSKEAGASHILQVSMQPGILFGTQVFRPTSLHIRLSPGGKGIFGKRKPAG